MPFYRFNLFLGKYLNISVFLSVVCQQLFGYGMAFALS